MQISVIFTRPLHYDFCLTMETRISGQKWFAAGALPANFKGGEGGVKKTRSRFKGGGGVKKTRSRTQERIQKSLVGG